MAPTYYSTEPVTSGIYCVRWTFRGTLEIKEFLQLHLATMCGRLSKVSIQSSSNGTLHLRARLNGPFRGPRPGSVQTIGFGILRVKPKIKFGLEAGNYSFFISSPPVLRLSQLPGPDPGGLWSAAQPISVRAKQIAHGDSHAWARLHEFGQSGFKMTQISILCARWPFVRLDTGSRSTNVSGVGAQAGASKCQRTRALCMVSEHFSRVLQSTPGKSAPSMS